MASSHIIELKEEKDGYNVLYIKEDNIKKYCINTGCTIFGVIAPKPVINSFIQENPEYYIKDIHSIVRPPVAELDHPERKEMTIIEMRPVIFNMKIVARTGQFKSCI